MTLSCNPVKCAGQQKLLSESWESISFPSSPLPLPWPKAHHPEIPHLGKAQFLTHPSWSPLKISFICQVNSVLFSKVFSRVCPLVVVTAFRRVMFHLTQTKRNKRLRKKCDCGSNFLWSRVVVFFPWKHKRGRSPPSNSKRLQQKQVTMCMPCSCSWAHTEYKEWVLTARDTGLWE